MLFLLVERRCRLTVHIDDGGCRTDSLMDYDHSLHFALIKAGSFSLSSVMLTCLRGGGGGLGSQLAL